MHRKIPRKIPIGPPTRNYRVFAVIMVVVWLILSMHLFLGVKIFPVLKGVKKLVNFKIFVLIMCKMKFVEWLGIDSGMLKLLEKIMNDFFWG